MLSAVFRSYTSKMVFTSLGTAAIYFSAVNKKILKHFTRLADISIRQEINKELKRVIMANCLLDRLFYFQLVTLFSAPNYCGEFDNAGGVLIVSKNLMCSLSILKVITFTP